MPTLEQGKAHRISEWTSTRLSLKDHAEGKGATRFWVPKRSQLPTRDHIVIAQISQQLRTSTKHPARVKSIGTDQIQDLGQSP